MSDAELGDFVRRIGADRFPARMWMDRRRDTSCRVVLLHQSPLALAVCAELAQLASEAIEQRRMSAPTGTAMGLPEVTATSGVAGRTFTRGSAGLPEGDLLVLPTAGRFCQLLRSLGLRTAIGVGVCLEPWTGTPSDGQRQVLWDPQRPKEWTFVLANPPPQMLGTVADLLVARPGGLDDDLLLASVGIRRAIRRLGLMEPAVAEKELLEMENLQADGLRAAKALGMSARPSSEADGLLAAGRPAGG
jgi:hypothetical protein